VLVPFIFFAPYCTKAAPMCIPTGRLRGLPLVDSPYRRMASCCVSTAGMPVVNERGEKQKAVKADSKARSME